MRAAGGLQGKTINDLQNDVNDRMVYILVTTRNNPEVRDDSVFERVCQGKMHLVVEGSCAALQVCNL